MTTDDRQRLFVDLDDLLDREREALMSGRLDQIPDLLAEKETLIDRLTALDGAELDLGPLRIKVERNQALLDGALRGIRAVASRFATLRKIRQSLETYDEQGRKNLIQTRIDGRLEKRA